MAVEMTIDLDKVRCDTLTSPHSSGARLFGSVFVLVLIGFVLWGGMHLSKPHTLPIRQVRVEGNFTHLSPVDLQRLVTDQVRGGFFNLDVDAVRLALLEEPWVSDVIVKRIWPDALRVIVIEQVPVVRWGDAGLLNAAGEFFAPEAATLALALPLLSGPDGTENSILARFNTMQERVQSIGLSIDSLTLDARRSWSLQFKGGIKVILGRHYFEERFNRVLTLIPITLSGRVDQAVLIDMRYTNGFSILWKNKINHLVKTTR